MVKVQILVIVKRRSNLSYQYIYTQTFGEVGLKSRFSEKNVSVGTSNVDLHGKKPCKAQLLHGLKQYGCRGSIVHFSAIMLQSIIYRESQDKLTATTTMLVQCCEMV